MVVRILVGTAGADLKLIVSDRTVDVSGFEVVRKPPRRDPEHGAHFTVHPDWRGRGDIRGVFGIGPVLRVILRIVFGVGRRFIGGGGSRPGHENSRERDRRLALRPNRGARKRKRRSVRQRQLLESGR